MAGKLTQQEAHILHLEMLRKVTGQLAALQQANDTLVEKWRAISVDWANPNHSVIYGTAALALRSTADELEAATKEATQ